MTTLGLERHIVDPQRRQHSLEQLKRRNVLLPTWAELAHPASIPDAITDALNRIDPDEPHPLNLFRVHWFNDSDRKTRVAVPNHVVLPSSLTGVSSPIVVLFGDRFPMIQAHKVLAAYGCLIPRLVTGQFDAQSQRAVWPSTGNYCRGGVAISRVLGCRGVAVLPEGMSEERFSWLRDWVSDPADIVRTVGTESNVKEIYDKCNELAADPQNLIFNQFCEFGNHLIHYTCTGAAMQTVFDHVAKSIPGLSLAAFVSATGSAGTLAAGDFLKDHYGCKIVAAEALECPTMLYNGFGEHNIQGIGDKHIPYIHNVTNTDVAVAVSDKVTDSLHLLFQTEEGRNALRQEEIPEETISALVHFGLSSNANLVAAIKTAKKLKLGANEAILTVATDGAQMYDSEIAKAKKKHFGGVFDSAAAKKVLTNHLHKADTDHTLEMGPRERDRIFNLGYFTWVEQQGVSVEAFEQRRSQDFWRGLRELVPIWDQMIRDVNDETNVEVM